jgi:hypothetical protein
MLIKGDNLNIRQIGEKYNSNADNEYSCAISPPNSLIRSQQHPDCRAVADRCLHAHRKVG